MKRKTKQFLTLFLAASLVVADGSFAVLADTVSGNQIEAEATVTEDVEMAKEAETTEEVETTEEQEEVLATEAEGEDGQQTGDGEQTGEGEQDENKILDLSQYDSEETAYEEDIWGKEFTYTSESSSVYVKLNLTEGKAYQIKVKGYNHYQIYKHNQYGGINTLLYNYYYDKNVWREKTFSPSETGEYFIELGAGEESKTIVISEVPFAVKSMGLIAEDTYHKEYDDTPISKYYGDEWAMASDIIKDDDVSLTYQWYRGTIADKNNLTMIEGANEETYAYPNTVEGLAYDYYECIITDEESGFSQTIAYPLTIKTLKQKKDSYSVTTEPGKEVVFKPEVENLVEGTELTYRWTYNASTTGSYDYQEYPDEKSDTLVIPKEKVVDDVPTIYECFVSNGYSKERILCYLQLTAGFEVMGNTLRDISVWAGDEIDLKPDVVSKEEISYRWYIGNNDKEIVCTDDTYHFVVPQNLEDCPGVIKCVAQDKYSGKTVLYYLHPKTADDKKPVDFIMADQKRIWTICKNAQENEPELSNFEGEFGGYAFKVVYEDGTEKELSSSARTTTIVPKDTNGRWKTGFGTVVHEYENFSVSRPMYVVRMGQNGTILEADGSVMKATAGSSVDTFGYYETNIDTIGKYQVTLSNVKGNGTLELIRPSYIRYPKYYEIKDGEDLEFTMDVGLNYDYSLGSYDFIVSATEGDVSYDISVKEYKITAEENKEIQVQDGDIVYFTPQESGFYGVTEKTEHPNYMYILNLTKNRYTNLSSNYYLKAGTTYQFSAGQDDIFEIELKEEVDQDYVFASADDGTKYEFFEDGTYCITVNDSNRYVRNELPSELGEEVKKLVIKGVAKKIVSHAFDYGLTNMESVNIEAPIEEIGYRAFYGNKNLKTVEVAKPELLKVVGQQAFEGTAFYEEQQGNYAMLGTCVVGYKKDSGETATVIPEKATMVAERAMQGVDTLEKIEILQNLKYIDSYSMSNNEKLQNMDIPGNVTDIAYCAFLFDRSMTYVKMAEGVEYIGEMAFHGCDDLKDVWIPKSVAYIGSWAIGYTGHPQYVNGNYYSYSYKKASDVDDEEEEEPKDELIIHCYFDTEGFRYAYNNGFKMDLMDAKDLANEKIARVNYGTSDGKIDYVNVTFARYIDLKDGVDFEYKVENGKIIITGKGDYFGTRIIDPNAPVPSKAPDEEPSEEPSTSPSGKPSGNPSSQPSQEVSAGPSESTSPSASVSPSADVTPSVKPSISPSAKPSVSPSVKPSTQPSQAPAELEAGKSYEAQGAKVTRGEDGNVVYQGPADANATNVTVPSKVVIGNKEYQVTEIADKAFEKNTKLKKVKIPAGIKTIGKNAFNKCTNLTSVTMGSDVTEIKDSAFAGCTKLIKVTISKKVTTIGKNAFKGDKKLKSIVIKSTALKSVKSGAFKGIAANAVIKVPKAKLKEYQKLLKKKGQGSKVKIKK